MVQLGIDCLGHSCGVHIRAQAGGERHGVVLKPAVVQDLQQDWIRVKGCNIAKLVCDRNGHLVILVNCRCVWQHQACTCSNICTTE